MEYDLIVIGGGPGGYVAAIRAAQRGLKTCLIEKKWIGGTCLNEGCIPTKTLLQSANVLEEVQRAEEFGVTGVDSGTVRMSLPRMQERRKAVIAQLQSGIKALIRRKKIDLIEGEVSLAGPKTVRAGNHLINAKNIILATGSVAELPRFIHCTDDSHIVSSRELLSIESVPASIAIVGGGVVGIEFACLLQALGSKTTVIEALPQILPMVDSELAALVRESLEKRGIDIKTSAKVNDIDGETVSFETDGKAEEIRAEKILIAIGRIPNVEGLDLESAGVKMDGKAIWTDDDLQTSVPGIYAVGDVRGKQMLAHMASHEGLAAVDHICGIPSSLRDSRVPSCIYSVPEIASVGLSEADAKNAGYEVKVGRFPMRNNGKALIEGYTDGMVKTVLDAKTGEILGVHICGPHASELIGGMAALMTAEATSAEILASVFPHPSVSESLGEAFMAAEGEAIHC